MPILFYQLLLELTSDAADTGVSLSSRVGEGYLVALLQTRPFQWIGEISMSFYLIHELVQGAILDASSAAGWIVDDDEEGEELAENSLVPLLLTTHLLPLGLSLLLGWFLTRTVERPLTRQLLRE